MCELSVLLTSYSAFLLLSLFVFVFLCCGLDFFTTSFSPVLQHLYDTLSLPFRVSNFKWKNLLENPENNETQKEEIKYGRTENNISYGEEKQYRSRKGKKQK